MYRKLEDEVARLTVREQMCHVEQSMIFVQVDKLHKKVSELLQAKVKVNSLDMCAFKDNDDKVRFYTGLSS